MFNHNEAQKYEFESASQYVDRAFEEIYEDVKNTRLSEKYSGVELVRFKKEFFSTKVADEFNFDDFRNSVIRKSILEIGSGPIGSVAILDPILYAVKKMIIIDPLFDKYRNYQIKKYEHTIFPVWAEGRSVNAEDLQVDLVGKIDGAIICRNCIDHTAAPFAIIDNINKYAAVGCHLLFWSEIWHNTPPDTGHTQVAEDPEVIRAAFRAGGWRIIRDLPHIPASDSIQYGCVAIKEL